MVLITNNGNNTMEKALSDALQMQSRHLYYNRGYQYRVPARIPYKNLHIHLYRMPYLEMS